MEIRDNKGTVEVRTNANGQPMLTGYGIVFNSDSENLGGFIEQVDPGAVTKTIAEADIRALANHDSGKLLGRVKSGTMRLSTDARGVRYEIDVNPDDPVAQSVYAQVQRGDMDGSSFCFETLQEQWDWDATPARRRLLEIKLVEMGPVVFPAYSESTAQARAKAALAKVASKLGHPVERMVEALKSGEIRSLVDAKPEENSTAISWTGTTTSSASGSNNVTVTYFPEERAVWSTSYIDDLPDSAFLYIEPGGEKDDEGKTKPRSLRHFPYKDANGNIDLPHLRNALARIPQSDLPQDVKDEITAKAEKILKAQGGENSAEPEGETRVGKKLSAASLAALQRAIDELQGLMGEMEPDEPDDDGDEMMRAILQSLSEFRDSVTVDETTPVAMQRAQDIARVRARELELLELLAT